MALSPFNSKAYPSFLFGSYTPVRSDTVVGELKLSEPSHIILPGNADMHIFSEESTFKNKF